MRFLDESVELPGKFSVVSVPDAINRHSLVLSEAKLLQGPLGQRPCIESHFSSTHRTNCDIGSKIPDPFFQVFFLSH